jgi:hypothetical protein
LSFAGVFSAPDDGPRLAALLASLAAGLLLPKLLGRRGHLWPMVIAPLLAAVLSAGYVAYYLRGGPRIIDATSYWLQGRALSEGMLAWPIADPEHGVLGRFLISTTVEGQPAASGIFPPGYPAVLALGFRLGAPMAVGPVIAALLVLATVALMGQVVRFGPDHWQAREPALVNVAATLSVICAALRYHTADTMSHGFAALCFTTVLVAVLRACGSPKGLASPGTTNQASSLVTRWNLTAARRGPVLLAGLASGGLLATRPASALALGMTIALLLLWLPEARRLWRLTTALAFTFAAIPGVTLWLAHGHAATGSIGMLAQSAYYSLSDGPPGCFRYGFGAGIGCLGEHGDFVRHNLADGYGLVAAAGTTLRRLKLHLADPLNAAPLFPLVLMGVVHGWRHRAARLISLAVVIHIGCYVPFYFDGNYPGGGARMFADVLPLEHLLAALGLLSLSATEASPRSRPWRALSLPLLASLVIGLSLLGFALRGGASHAQLRDREGGRPMFEPSVVADQGAGEALLLVDTDHGFNLAYDPTGRTPVARYRGDDMDRLTWERQGRPKVVRYRYQWPEGGRARAWLEPISFDLSPTGERELTIEGESLWPPAAQQGGWAWPSFSAHPCVSAGRFLALYPTVRSAEAMAAIRLPTSLAGRSLEPRLFSLVVDESNDGRTEPKARNKRPTILEVYSGSALIHHWQVEHLSENVCLSLPAYRLPSGPQQLSLRLRAQRPIAIDSLIFGEKR